MRCTLPDTLPKFKAPVDNTRRILAGWRLLIQKGSSLCRKNQSGAGDSQELPG
jgi:hypothetical protein